MNRDSPIFAAKNVTKYCSLKWQFHRDFLNAVHLGRGHID
jgi:hypothetical protein